MGAVLCTATVSRSRRRDGGDGAKARWPPQASGDMTRATTRGTLRFALVPQRRPEYHPRVDLVPGGFSVFSLLGVLAITLVLFFVVAMTGRAILGQ
jgi:hypothetical protein